MSTDPYQHRQPPTAFGMATGAFMFFGIAGVCLWYSIVGGLTFGWVLGPILIGVGLVYVGLTVRMRRAAAARRAALHHRGHRPQGPAAHGHFPAPAPHQYPGAPRNAAPPHRGAPYPPQGPPPGPYPPQGPPPGPHPPQGRPPGHHTPQAPPPGGPYGPPPHR